MVAYAFVPSVVAVQMSRARSSLVQKSALLFFATRVTLKDPFSDLGVDSYLYLFWILLAFVALFGKRPDIYQSYCWYIFPMIQTYSQWQPLHKYSVFRGVRSYKLFT